MIDFLYSIDVTIFFFINHSLANPILDWVMPFLTDLNKQKPVWVIAVALVGWVVWKGGPKGRAAIGVLIVTIIISDQFNSSLLKGIFHRLRPCSVLEGVRLLVHCGSGLSFPSSHAVNNFAGAFVISHFYTKQKWFWFLFASLVALSRPYVGVHYPSDIFAGACIGIGIGFFTTALWEGIKIQINFKKKNKEK